MSDVVRSPRRAILSVTASDGSGSSLAFRLDVVDGGEPGRGADSVRMRLPSIGYDVAGLLGGGNLQVEAG